MEPATIASAIAGATSRSEVRRLLRKAPAGTNAAVFDRLVAQMGANPKEAAKLAGHWDLLALYGDDRAIAFRIKGAGERLAGKWKASAESLQHAAMLAMTPVTRLSYAAGAVDSLARAGEIDAAVALGKRLSKGLRRLGEPALAARIELNLANALLWRDDYAGARRWLGRALADLDAAGLEREAAAARLALSTSELYGGLPLRAREHAAAARATFTGLDLPHHADLAAINLAQASLNIGRAEDALALLLEIRDRVQAADPLEAARVEEFLGDAYLRLNLWTEATDAYGSALARPAMRRLPLNRANTLMGLGMVALASGDPERAAQWLTQAHRAYRRFGNAAWSAACEVCLAEAKLETDQPRAAIRFADRALGELRQAGAPYWRAAAQTVRAAAHLREGGDARPALDEALRTIRARGYVSLHWRALAVRAQAAPPRQRIAAYRRTFEAMLGARLLVSSTVSQAHFLRDKTRALTDYLELLLARPTPKRVREALDVIARSRSVTLLDEIAASNPALLDEGAQAKLAELRERLSGVADPEASGPARFVASEARELASIQRRWVEAVLRAEEPKESAGAVRPATAPPVVYVEGNQAIYRLADPAGHALSITRPALERALGWLSFDLLAPLAEPDADPRMAMDALARLRDALEMGQATRISPDGLLWQVPWSALGAMDDRREETVLVPSPAFESAAGETCLPERPRVLLWLLDDDRLPHIREEARHLCEVFPDAVVCRTADEARASLAQGEVDLLHVAAHARHHARNPMFSFLELNGGRVYATEIARSGLRIGMATLSACHTGSVSVAVRQEPDGLARAMLARSARAVVASAWPLDDAAAAVTMRALYGGLVEGRPLGAALRHARRAVRERWPHPYYWGPLTLFGGYRS